MKIENIDSRVAALYYGQMCTCTWIEIGEVADFPISTITLNNVYYGVVSITPHLRRIESLTEEEARELYEIERGVKWNTQMYSQEEPLNGSCLDKWWNQDEEWYNDLGSMLVGSPLAWLHLLSKGFDLFGLIDSGLAKDVNV